MKIVREIREENYNLTIYAWNNKYLLKFEQGGLEQTYKISEMDILQITDLDMILSSDFLKKVLARFDEMAHDFSNAVKVIY